MAEFLQITKENGLEVYLRADAHQPQADAIHGDIVSEMGALRASNVTIPLDEVKRARRAILGDDGQGLVVIDAPR